jgi:hypothetical protein
MFRSESKVAIRITDKEHSREWTHQLTLKNTDLALKPLYEACPHDPDADTSRLGK